MRDRGAQQLEHLQARTSLLQVPPFPLAEARLDLLGSSPKSQLYTGRSSLSSEDTLLLSSRDELDLGAQDKPGVELSSSVEESEAASIAVFRALAAHVLFQGCPSAFLRGLAARAERRKVAPGALVRTDEDCLIVVERGALHVRVGDNASQPVAMGPGSIFNGGGFLRLREEVYCFKPSRATIPDLDAAVSPAEARRIMQSNGYHIQASTEGAVPEAIGDRRHSADPLARSSSKKRSIRTLTTNELCFFGLCPYAAVTRRLWSKSSLLPLKVLGAHPSDASTRARAQGGTALHDSGGAILALIPSLTELVDNGSAIAAKRMGLPHAVESLAMLEKRCNERMAMWRALMKTFGDVVLPGAPPEAIWAVTEISDAFCLEDGCEIVREGDHNQDLVVIVDGVATVERAVSWRDGLLVKEVIGRVRGGAVIGDLGLLGAGVPRPATVVATTRVEGIRVPVDPFLQVLDRYPGLIRSCESRLKEVAELIGEFLPTRTEVVRSLNLFNVFDLPFISDIARLGQRRMLFCAQAIVEEGSRGGTLFVLEHGRCAVELAGRGRVAEVPAGNCFGERTLLGSSAANATVRVLTPMALVFLIAQSALHSTLDRHPQAASIYEQMKSAPGEGRIKGRKLRNVQLFRFCGNAFLEALSDMTRTRCYLPGQTIFIEGEMEEDVRMFALVGGGRLVAELGEQVTMLPHNATVGELAFLGRAERRPVTVRAATLSTLLEIPRSAFRAALEAFPEEEQHFEQGLGKGSEAGSSVVWPFLTGADPSFLFLVELHAEQRQCQPGVPSSTTTEGAILLLAGEAAIVDNHGVHVESLSVGNCFNEHALVGATIPSGWRFEPITTCKVRMLSPEHLDKIFAEFPEQSSSFHEAVANFIAERAEARLGHEPGGVRLLRGALTFLSIASDDFVLRIKAMARPRLYGPGEKIADQEREDAEDSRCAYILVEGMAVLTDPFVTKEVALGSAFGEAVMLGVAARHSGELTARTQCLALVLRRADLEEALLEHPEERAALGALSAQASSVDTGRIRALLARNSRLHLASQDVLAKLCPAANIVIFPPNTVVTTSGEVCTLGSTCFYLLLAGRVYVEGAVGTVLGHIDPGDTFGEVAAFGLAEKRTATTYTWNDGLVACSCITGPAIMEALRFHPTARGSLLSSFRRSPTCARSNSAESGLRRSRSQRWRTRSCCAAAQRTSCTIWLSCSPRSFTPQAAQWQLWARRRTLWSSSLLAPWSSWLPPGSEWASWVRAPLSARCVPWACSRTGWRLSVRPVTAARSRSPRAR